MSKTEHQESKQSTPYIQHQKILRQLTVFHSMSCGFAAMPFCRHMLQAAAVDRALSKTGPFQ